ncbi:unnamed protein product, partial [Didymodactylos carnosus]
MYCCGLCQKRPKRSVQSGEIRRQLEDDEESDINEESANSYTERRVKLNRKASAAPHNEDFSSHLDISRLTVPKKVEHVKLGHTLCSNDELLILQDGITALQVQDHTLEPQHVHWNHGLIRDICWSSLRRIFICICQKRVHSFDPMNVESQINTFSHILPYEEKYSFWRCTCTQSTLFICYAGHGTTIDEYDLSSSPVRLKKQWNSPRSCLETEGIWSIRCGEDQIGLTIMDSITEKWHLEVRTLKMGLLWRVDLPITG